MSALFVSVLLLPPVPFVPNFLTAISWTTSTGAALTESTHVRVFFIEPVMAAYILILDTVPGDRPCTRHLSFLGDLLSHSLIGTLFVHYTNMPCP